MKFVIGIGMLIFSVICGILLKMEYDLYTNSTVGFLALAGADSNTMAVSALIPWAIPIIVFIIVIIMWTRDSSPPPQG